MTDRPLIIRPAFLQGIRAGRRSHIFLPGTFVPGQRTGTSAISQRGKPPGMRLPTPWSKLQPGDRLWLQEEIAGLVGTHHSDLVQTFYKVELPGGHVPIPGGVRAGKWRTVAYDARRCPRDASRFTLEVTAIRLCTAQETTWDEIKREGTYDPHSTIGSWWGYQYGILMPWPENPGVVGMDFRFIDGNIDTGQRWVPEEKPKAPPNAALARMFGTPSTD